MLIDKFVLSMLSGMFMKDIYERAEFGFNNTVV